MPGSTDRRTAAQRGYGHAWRRESRLFLAENSRCAMRGNGCTIVATVVDHKVPHKGDTRLFWDRSNWQGLCAHCHNLHKQKQEAATMGGLRDHKGRLIVTLALTLCAAIQLSASKIPRCLDHVARESLQQLRPSSIGCRESADRFGEADR